MESIGSFGVRALVRMHEHREHPEPLLDFLIVGLLRQVQNVVRVHEVVVEQPVQLVLGGELLVVRGQLLHFFHELSELLLKIYGFLGNHRLGLIRLLLAMLHHYHN